MNIKLKGSDQVKVLGSKDIFKIMQRVLKRENKIDRNREHFWTIALDNANKILNIELVSLGSINRTIVEPMEVFSVPLQKRAVKLVIAHNHPSGELNPSDSDKDITDKLIQCGFILNVPVLDHLIISEKTYYSFKDRSLMDELETNSRYIPNYRLKEQLRKAMENAKAVSDEVERKAKEMAKLMKDKGEPVEKIIAYTELTEEVVNGL